MDNLWKMAIVLLILWLVGVITEPTFGGAVHALLIAAIAIALIRIFQGKKPVT